MPKLAYGRAICTVDIRAHRNLSRDQCTSSRLRVLISKLLDLARLIHFQTGVLRFPLVVRLFCDSGLADQLSHRYIQLLLLQNINDPLYGKTSSSSANFLGLLQAGSCQNTNCPFGSVFARPIILPVKVRVADAWNLAGRDQPHKDKEDGFTRS